MSTVGLPRYIGERKADKMRKGYRAQRGKKESKGIFPGKSICHPNQPIIVSEENGCKFVANNKTKGDVYHYKIDGDIVNDKVNRKCDYMIEKNDRAYLVELKGKHLNDALEQLENTEKLFKAELAGFTLCMRVVYRPNTHAVYSSKARIFIGKHPDFKCGTIKMEEDI